MVCSLFFDLNKGTTSACFMAVGKEPSLSDLLNIIHSPLLMWDPVF